jgi:nicotinamidase-related amidase
VKNKSLDQWRGTSQENNLKANDVHGLIDPKPGEVSITKKKPSAFFGTPLSQYLITLGVDQLLCCGTTTSGCVRATVIDAFSSGYRVAVIEDCTFDRGQASHAVNLFDMDQKYSNVMSSPRIIEYIEGLSADLFPDWAEAVVSVVA